MKVKNRLKVLIAEKEMRENRRLTYRQLADETGLSLDTILGYMTQRVSRYDASTLATLCEYLECDVGDLLILDPGQDGKTGQQKES
jgi:putative transcriptional regulator